MRELAGTRSLATAVQQSARSPRGLADPEASGAVASAPPALEHRAEGPATRCAPRGGRFADGSHPARNATAARACCAPSPRRGGSDMTARAPVRRARYAHKSAMPQVGYCARAPREGRTKARSRAPAGGGAASCAMATDPRERLPPRRCGSPTATAPGSAPPRRRRRASGTLASAAPALGQRGGEHGLDGGPRRRRADGETGGRALDDPPAALSQRSPSEPVRGGTAASSEYCSQSWVAVWGGLPSSALASRLIKYATQASTDGPGG